MTAKEIKTLLKLLKSIETVLLCVHEDIARVRKQSDTEEQECKVRPNPITVNAELNLPPAIREYYEAKNRSKWGPRLKTLLEIGALGAAVWLGILNLKVLRQVETQTPRIAEGADAGKSAADTAAKQLELAYRPWVYTNIEVTKPLRFDKDGAKVQVKTSTRNNGNSPANVYVRSKIYVPNFANALNNERSVFCGEAATYGSEFDGWSLVPNSTPQEIFYDLSATRQDMENAARNRYASVPETFKILVIVCTVYDSPAIAHGRVFSPYYSDSVYALFHVLANKRASGDFRIGEVIPVKDLALTPSPGGSTFVR